MGKKLSLALVLLVGMFAVTLHVSAMTEGELLEKVSATYTINGDKIKVKDGVLTEVERYFSENEVSSSDCDYISDKIDEAIAIAKKGTATNWNEMTSSEKAEIIELVEEISSNTAVKATLTSDGKLTVYDTDGEVFTKLDDVVISVDEEDGASTVNTSITDSATIIIGGISLIGLLLVTKKVVKANA